VIEESENNLLEYTNLTLSRPIKAVSTLINKCEACMPTAGAYMYKKVSK